MDTYYQGTVGNQPVLWGTARGALVTDPATDAAYRAWLTTNAAPNSWPRDASPQRVQSWASLDDALAFYGLPPSGHQVAASRAYVISQARAAADDIIAQVFPTIAHQVGYSNAATVIAANGGVIPTEGPYAASLAALVANFAPMNSTQVAQMFVALHDQGHLLVSALDALTAAAGAASSNSDLASALSAFEAALGAVVTAVNAAVPAPIVAPPAITAAGVNA